ncbi:DUF7344 domain-containing protein [Halomicrococcus sp. SG-WS-1]|uniref:DUF7344 domain-containing protein n=1 Tax=Halomicrococcus sp. SG-WS-1 TaxID=3439057 RepID=UPI003F7ACB8E
MTSSELSEDDVFEILKSTRRRYALHYLRHEGSSGDLSTLATHVAAWEYDTTPEELMPKQRKRVYISLYQTHLPKLEEVGLLRFDEETGRIHLSDRARTLDKYLSVGSRPVTPWYHYYLSLSLLSLLVIGGIWVRVTPLTLLSRPTALTLILSLFTVLALGQYLCYYRCPVQESPPEP